MKIELVFEDCHNRQIRMTGNDVIVHREARKNKGYLIWTGTVHRNGKSYFIKFVERFDDPRQANHCDSYQNEMFYHHAVQRFEKEKTFRMRYPFISYVYSVASQGMVFFADDKESMKVWFLLAEDCGKEALSTLYYDNVPDDDTMYCQMLQLLYAMNYYTMLQNGKDEDRIIHRDLKPDNIMVLNGQVKIIDFDWAHLNDAMGTRGTLTPIYGTETYAHPQQFDPKCKHSFIGMDIYSMGLVFLYMINHRSYYRYLKNLTIYPPRDHRLYLNYVDKRTPEWLRTIIARMIAKRGIQYEWVSEVIRDFSASLQKYHPALYKTFRRDLLEQYHVLPDGSEGDTVQISLRFRTDRSSDTSSLYKRYLKNGESDEIHIEPYIRIRFLRAGDMLFYVIRTAQKVSEEKYLRISACEKPVTLTLPMNYSRILLDIQIRYTGKEV